MLHPAGRLGAHPNWLGDWIRYSSFALASGYWKSCFLPLFVIFLNYKTQNARKEAVVRHLNS